MAEYRLTVSPDIVVRTVDMANIPADPGNRDWLDYEAWRIAGGVPDPAPTQLGSSQMDWSPTMHTVLGDY